MPPRKCSRPDAEERYLIRAVSKALKHQPELFGVQLDEDGWTSLTGLVEALQRHRTDWTNLSVETLATILTRFEPHRFTIDGSSIRAAYGHSIARRISFPAALPPEILFHATNEQCAWKIVDEGLRRVTARQYVHLAPEKRFATRARKDRKCQPIVFVVRAREAHALGTAFYQTSTPMVWLADAVEARFIDIETRTFRVRAVANRVDHGAADTSRPPPI